MTAATQAKPSVAARELCELGVEMVGSGALAVPLELPVRSLSAGSIARFERCQSQWQAHYLLGRRDPPNLKMAAGSAIGNTLAALFAARIAGEGEISPVDADDRLAAEWEFEAGACAGVEAGEVDEVGEGLRAPLRAYLEQVAPEIRPAAVEREVRFGFSGASWSVVGYLDLETEAGECIDYKCSTKHLAPARALTDIQPTTYLLAKTLEGAEAPSFAYHSLRRGRVRDESDRIRRVPAERTTTQIEGMGLRIASVARQIARAATTDEWAYSTQGWWCGEGMCANWERCPAGGLVSGPDPSA
ncbi:MAG: PD-(D/E)XK nuclease family protein [Solirubrobacterales bacterium]